MRMYRDHRDAGLVSSGALRHPARLPELPGGLRPPLRSPRSGFTVVELVATVILLGVVFTVSVSMLAAVARERRSAEERQFALQHAANLLERTAAKPWSDIASGPQSIAEPSTDLQAMLPGLEQRVEAVEDKEDYESKRVTVTLRWKNRAGQYVSPIQLTTWVYPLGEVTP